MLSQERFEELYGEFWGYVYAICVAALGNPEEAEDAAQEVFVRKWREREVYDPARGSFRSWLSCNAMHVCVDHLRRRGRQKRLAEVSYSQPAGEGEGTTTALQVEACLKQLSRQERLYLVMRDVFGFTWEELAAAGGLSVGAVRRLVQRARSRFRDCLSK